jgi:hypothetical protein
MILRVPGDPNRLEQYTNDNADMVRQISEAGKSAGAIHHAFAGGDGEILVIDEWSDEQAFQAFFSGQPDIPRMMQDVGVQSEPQVSFYRKLNTPDEF